MSELFFLILIAYAVCFILFTLLFAIVHRLSNKTGPFRNAAADVVDLLVLTPVGWAISLLYFLYLVAVFPLWWLRRK
ncbi:hypothetical protein [Metabacillus sp. 84]|uniref:hypothetical protein n=1 Tax=unclassified Metabacillus TaxID=2675274 RepID=UPI003CF900C2